ncbi:MAG: hypothetical protein EA356_09185 [Geminicoccaceae bacterium]|nr:MAG: hypothetical protein EA356_09185 [Geminicoccaceae bacterium]
MGKVGVMRGCVLAMLAMAPAMAPGMAIGTAAVASELDFTYQTRLPDVTGELERSFAASDPALGLRVVKRVYASEVPGFRILHHVASISCGEGASLRPYIVALQLIPRAPQSFAIATLADGFTEVYVEDETGRVRLYRNVAGYVMAELTDRFRPHCPNI